MKYKNNWFPMVHFQPSYEGDNAKVNQEVRLKICNREKTQIKEVLR